MPVYRGAGGAGDATNDATVTAVQAAATSAATSATNAANSATAAANSATGAATSATNASNSATTAAGSVATAAGHATNASTFATNASLSADDASDSADEAQQYASEANDAEVAASASASAAAASEAAALAAQGAAETAYDDTLAIFGDATDVANAVAAAQLAETNAETAETNAETAATTATNAASTATTQAAAALVSANNADADATAASIDANEAQAAAIAAQAAVSSATAIYGSIEDIQQAEANSEANRDAAAASATSASNSASTATTQAGIATTQASAASASAAAASAVALGNEPVRHSVRPSLLLDFANTKTLDPRITFTRASTGTFYDGKTVAKAEENFLLYSQTFDEAGYWSANGVTVTANATTAPDGTTTAEAAYETATTAPHRIFKTNFATVSTSLPHVFSVYAKAITTDRFVFRTGAMNSDTDLVRFDLTAVTATNIGAGATSSSITSVGSGWFRCVVVFTPTATTGSFYIGLVDSSNNLSYAGNTSNGLFLWGAQAEQRSSVTAYQVTTTAPITNYIPALQSAASGVARFEHNPITGESLGLEIEEQRTNLLTYSSDYSNAAWTKTNSTIAANSVIAPDGTLTGAVLTGNSTSGQHLLSQLYSSVGSGKTISVFAKAGTNNFLQIYTDFVATDFANFNLSTGAVGTVGSTASATITPVGNGWYRCTVTTGSASSQYVNFHIITSATSVRAEFNTLTTSLSLWGAQLEAGAFATSYIPTVASQVTRSPDSATMTGTNFSSWYRADEGSFYGEFITIRTGAGLLGDQTGSSAILYSNSRDLLTFNGTNGAAATNSYTSNIPFKGAVSYSASGRSVTLNAGTVGTSTGLMQNITTFTIGRAFSSIYLNGNIKKVAYYPLRLTNAELQGLTTV